MSFVVDVELVFVLDSKKPKDTRMYFLSNPGMKTLNKTLTLYKDGQQRCEQNIVYIKVQEPNCYLFNF